MKQLSCLFVLLLASASLVLEPASVSADTGVETKTTLVHTAGKTITIPLNTETVICSQADYSLPVLKVLIPELAALTLLDHQNFGAGAPCVAAGACIGGLDGSDGASPGDILDPNKPEEIVDVFVTARRQDYINHAAKTCEVYLIEDVKLDIRGVAFSHRRTMGIGSRNYEDCLL